MLESWDRGAFVPEVEALHREPGAVEDRVTCRRREGWRRIPLVLGRVQFHVELLQLEVFRELLCSQLMDPVAVHHPCVALVDGAYGVWLIRFPGEVIAPFQVQEHRRRRGDQAPRRGQVAGEVRLAIDGLELGECLFDVDPRDHHAEKPVVAQELLALGASGRVHVQSSWLDSHRRRPRGRWRSMARPRSEGGRIGRPGKALTAAAPVPDPGECAPWNRDGGSGDGGLELEQRLPLGDLGTVGDEDAQDAGALGQR